MPKELKTGNQRGAFLTNLSHKHVLHFTPKHGSRRNQVELWFSVLARRFLQRGEFCSAEEFEERLSEFLDDYHASYAHPFRWTYTGEPLVRDAPFSRTRRQPKRGRAWSSPRPRLLERLICFDWIPLNAFSALLALASCPTTVAQTMQVSTWSHVRGSGTSCPDLPPYLGLHARGMILGHGSWDTKGFRDL
jgi:hypothetical protein